MTGRDLFRQLQQFGDLDVQESTVVGWIDMCQKKSSLDLPVVVSLDIGSVSPGLTVTVKGGVFKVLSAESNEGEYPLSSVSVGPTYLKFSRSATGLKLRYSTIAPDFTAIDQELSIHPSLHAPMVYFLVSMYYDMEGEGDSEESSLAERYYQRWVYYRNMAIASLIGSDNELSMRDPVETRDVLPRTRYYREDGYFE